MRDSCFVVCFFYFTREPSLFFLYCLFFLNNPIKIFTEPFYLNKVDYAITQANSNFATGLDDLIGNDTSDDSRCGKIGTNMPELFKLLREV